MIHNCWTDPKNANKHPSDYKVPEINAAAATNKRSTELQLANNTWKSMQKLLQKTAMTKTILSFIAKKAQDKKQIGTGNCKGNFVAIHSPQDKRIGNPGRPQSLTTQHSTGHGTGLVNLRDAHDSTTRVGKGQIVKVKAIGKLLFVQSWSGQNEDQNNV